MPAFVKTKKDEELWSKAKSRAKEQGHEGDWAYVTGIYKKMKGGKVAAERRLVAGPRWRDIGDDEKRAMRRALAPVMIEDEEAVVLPSDVRRVSAERLRELGRALMVAGMRAPRQQMISIAVTLDALLDHLKLLGDQSPALNALRRRVLLKMRNQVLGSR